MHHHPATDSHGDDEDLMNAARAMIGLFERALDSGDESVPVADARLLAMASAGYSVSVMARRIGQTERSVREAVERLADAHYLSPMKDAPSDRAPMLRDRGRRVITDLGVRHRHELEQVLGRLGREQRNELVEAFDIFALIEVATRSDAAAEDSAPDSAQPTN